MATPLDEEAQNRTLEIEAALERVRARTMAMHHSSEMQQIANVMYEQMVALGLEMDAVGMSGVIEVGKEYIPSRQVESYNAGK